MVNPLIQLENLFVRCQYLHGKHTLFSSSLAAAIILGFVLTPHWRKSLDILDSLRRSPPSMEAYIALVERAIQDKDEHLVWNIFERITANHLFLNNDLFALYLSHCETNATTFKENVDKMLTTIGTKRILLSVEAANEIQRVFRRLHYRCDITTVNERWVLPNRNTASGVGTLILLIILFQRRVSLMRKASAS